MTCTSATQILLAMMQGEYGDTCDIVDLLYENDLSQKSYRGIKSQFLAATSYIFQLTSIGMGLEATLFSLKTDNPADWMISQNKMQLDHREALYRI
jgi:hypothetical protein